MMRLLLAVSSLLALSRQTLPAAGQKSDETDAAEAAKEGKKLYLKDGKGRIGPSLQDDKWRYDRAGTDKGRFEIMYAGSADTIQAFGKRIDQDQILKIMTFTDTFRKAKRD